MSYIKNVIIRNFSILRVEGESEGEVIASLGDNITTVLSIDYYESIFEPTIAFELLFVSIDNALSDATLRGTERANIEIDHQSGTLSFENLVVTSFVQNQSESTANTFVVRLEPIQAILNQKNRLVKRYDPKVKASSHVETILTTQLECDKDEIDIEETANNDGFFGNYWTPFKGIYWLARRAVSASMPEDGGGTDRVGFLFWMTQDGYKFKSIDTIISDAKKNGALEYTQNDSISNNPNYDIYNPKWEFDQSIIDRMISSDLGEKKSYFNLHTLYNTEEISFSKAKAKQAHLGSDETPILKEDLNEDPTRIIRVPILDYTMRRDGTYNEGDGEYQPHKVRSQARMRYASLLSSSLRITVPLQTQIQAGDIISCKLIDSMKGTDKWLSGFFLIKDLRHTIHFTKSGVECYTYLRLVRDTPGYD